MFAPSKLAGYAALMALGFGLYLARADMPYSPAVPLASGLQVRASSYDPHRQSHPLFAVDGTASGALLWAPHPKDAEPWLTVRFAEPRDLEGLALVMSGRDIAGTVRCEEAAGGAGASAPIPARGGAVALPCAAARAVHLTFSFGARPRVLEVTPRWR